MSSGTVVFYEKPGCVSNTRQKAILEARGHRLEVHDLLAESWTPETLRPFFGERPVAEWFNPSAPGIKSGRVDPGHLEEAEALALMLADPLLIRRPLLHTVVGCCCGFEPGPVLDHLGIVLEPGQDLQSCARPGLDTPCEPPDVCHR